MQISNSSFTDIPGDVLGEFNFGSHAVTQLTLDNVEAGHSVGAGLIQPIAGLLTQAGNLGDCLVMTSAAAGNTMTLTMRNSRLSDWGGGTGEVSLHFGGGTEAAWVATASSAAARAMRKPGATSFP